MVYTAMADAPRDAEIFHEEWDATTEPQLERISTWNAHVNEYMIAVNEAIGYTVFGQPNTWSRLDVTAVPGSRG